MASEAQPISAAPAEGQLVDHDGKRYTTIREGAAYILVPDTAQPADNNQEKLVEEKDGVQQVFYNPIQQYNRDLTVLAIKAYGKLALQAKKEHFDKRQERFAGKKRKRTETAGEERLGKSPKAAEPATQDPATSAAATQSEDVAMQAASEAEPARNGASTEATTHVAEADDGAQQDSNGTASKTGEEIAETVGEDSKAEPVIAPKFTILDALSASGLRALRYAKELPFVTQITANDLSAKAVASIRRNARHNGIQDRITVTEGDALAHMYGVIAQEASRRDSGRSGRKSEKYDVIDLDPYGTAAPFFDAAVQAVRDDGGLLCVTCTDAGVWASNGYPEKTFALYGGIPMKGSHSHEAGLRLILNSIATSASRYGLVIEPQLSLSIDFYARLFVKVRKSPAGVKFQAGKTMVVYNCDQGCGAWSTQLLLKNKAAVDKKNGVFYKHHMSAAPTAGANCEFCGFKTHLAGPMYAGRLHSPDFIQSILDDLPEASTDVYHTMDRIKGMLTTALEELMEGPQTEEEARSPDAQLASVEPYPFFFMPSQLSRAVHCQTPNENAFRGALRGLGYHVTRSHCRAGSIKTDAPFSVLWEVMRAWVKQRAPVNPKHLKEGSPARRLLRLEDEPAAEEKHFSATGEEVDKIRFDEKLGREHIKERLVRYQMNPRENWGPLNRAKAR